jgi:hypothetical protein
VHGKPPAAQFVDDLARGDFVVFDRQHFQHGLSLASPVASSSLFRRVGDCFARLQPMPFIEHPPRLVTESLRAAIQPNRSNSMKKVSCSRDASSAHRFSRRFSFSEEFIARRAFPLH